MYHYQVGRFAIAVAIEVPELPPSRQLTPELTIRLDDIPNSLSEATAQQAIEVHGQDLLAHLGSAGRFLVRGTDEVIFPRDSPVTDDDYRTGLIGSALATVFHRRGLLPLHGSAVAFAEEAIAFVGASGAGKSTLAAAFSKSEGLLLADDILLLEPPVNCAHATLHPLLPVANLFADSLRATLKNSSSPADARGKYRVRQGAPHARQALPLRRIYLIEEDATLSIENVPSLHGLAALCRHISCHAVVSALDLERTAFERCARVCETTKISRLKRPKVFGQLDSLLDALKADLQSGACRATALPRS